MKCNVKACKYNGDRVCIRPIKVEIYEMCGLPFDNPTRCNGYLLKETIADFQPQKPTL